MKTKLIFLVLLIACFSCGTNNKPVSDAQKEKIKGEVKDAVKSLYKACEEVNFEAVMQHFLDSPDFITIYNGGISNYKEYVDGVKLNYNNLINQKGTELGYEKYVILDNSTVIYTFKSKWIANLKDGHSLVADTAVSQFIFRKIKNNWKIINEIEFFKSK
jgi:SnoaL-like domain